MNLMDMSFKRTTYEIDCKYSILFECALGIAVITYPKVHDHLEKPRSYWKSLRSNVSTILQSELSYCQKHNTWKMNETNYKLNHSAIRLNDKELIHYLERDF